MGSLVANTGNEGASSSHTKKQKSLKSQQSSKKKLHVLRVSFWILLLGFFLFLCLSLSVYV